MKDENMRGVEDFEIVTTPAPGTPNAILNRWSMVIFHARQVALAVETERFKRGHGEARMPQITWAEREDRIEQMRSEFAATNPGLMTEERMPGRRLQDMFYKMVYNDRIQEYPHPELCTSEHQERQVNAPARRCADTKTRNTKQRGST